MQSQVYELMLIEPQHKTPNFKFVSLLHNIVVSFKGKTAPRMCWAEVFQKCPEVQSEVLISMLPQSENVRKKPPHLFQSHSC